MSRCTGHCCERFNLPYSMGELQRYAQAIREEKSLFILDNGKEKFTPSNGEEILQVANMIIFKEWSKIGMDGNLIGKLIEAKSSIETLESRGFRIDEDGDLITPIYTCKHFDMTTRNCTNYENRPTMCRDYPYDRKCDHKGCTYCDERKQIIEEGLKQLEECQK